MNYIDVSVVIGFKDWGLERLRISIGTINASLGDLDGEIVISDYGSERGAEVQRSVEKLGARYIRTETDGTWSRSRALNAGLSAARGRVLITTDADMAFSPLALKKVASQILDDPQQSIVLQCRDLPEGYSHEDLDGKVLDWYELDLVSKIRPRWGMGGMFAASRATVESVQGYDERMHTYGGEDLDFATRVRRSGSPIHWIDESDVRMYHIWHPSSQAAADDSIVATKAIEFNRKILREDKTFVRNVRSDFVLFRDSGPVCSVICVIDETNEHFYESVTSVLSQSVQNIELVIVITVDNDRVKRLIESLTDPRVRIMEAYGESLCAAFCLALGAARAGYSMIHIIGDIMGPTRVSEQFRALNQGFAGTYGGIILFDEDGGKSRALNNTWFAEDEINELVASQTYRGLMVKTDLLSLVADGSENGADFWCDLLERLVYSGIRLNHTGRYHALVQTDASMASSDQFAVARLRHNRPLSIATNADKKPPNLHPKGQDYDRLVLSLMPDKRARKAAIVRFRSPRLMSSTLNNLHSEYDWITAQSTDGDVLICRAVCASISAEDLLRLSQIADASVEVKATALEEDFDDTFTPHQADGQLVWEIASKLSEECFPEATSHWLVTISGSLTPSVPSEIDSSDLRHFALQVADPAREYILHLNGSPDFGSVWTLRTYLNDSEAVPIGILTVGADSPAADAETLKAAVSTTEYEGETFESQLLKG